MEFHRPFYLISSNIVATDVNGNNVGEVRMDWSPFRRKYDIIDENKKQFAKVDEPMLSWDFAMKDENGNKLAAVNRNWSGIGKELFTDAGQYLVHLESETKKIIAT